MALQPNELSVLHDDVDLDRDRVLVERCQSGDSSAFGELYSRYYARVYRFCFRRLHDHEEAEDVAQDAFARAWRALPTFAGERRFYPWLTVIADNRCRDIQRRRVRSTPTADVDIAAKQAAEPVSVDTPEDALIASVEGDLAVQALGRLSARHRQVLSLREGSGWTYQEIATHEGVEIRTVESLIWRARQALKREYASIASVNSVIGGIALGRWGALRRGGASLARRVHPLGAVLSSTGGARGVATGMALTSFAVVAAAMPGSSPPAPHPVAAVAPAGATVAPAGQGGSGQVGSRGGSGGNGGSYPRGSAAPAPPPSVPTPANQATTSAPSTTAGASPPPGSVGTGGPGGTGAATTGPGLSPVPPGQIPSGANTVVPGSGASAVPPTPPFAASLLPPLPIVSQLPSVAAAVPSLTAPVLGSLGGQ
jgi:RNA polymerase sigma-70 factor (ECF subfamily)